MPKYTKTVTIDHQNRIKQISNAYFNKHFHIWKINYAKVSFLKKVRHNKTFYICSCVCDCFDLNSKLFKTPNGYASTDQITATDFFTLTRISKNWETS